MIGDRHADAACALVDFYIGQRMTLEVDVATSDPKREEVRILIDKTTPWLDSQPGGYCFTLRDFTKLAPYCILTADHEVRLKVLSELVSRDVLDVHDVKPASGGRSTTKWVKN